MKIWGTHAFHFPQFSAPPIPCPLHLRHHHSSGSPTPPTSDPSSITCPLPRAQRGWKRTWQQIFMERPRVRGHMAGRSEPQSNPRDQPSATSSYCPLSSSLELFASLFNCILPHLCWSAHCNCVSIIYFQFLTGLTLHIFVKKQSGI